MSTTTMTPMAEASPPRPDPRFGRLRSRRVQAVVAVVTLLAAAGVGGYLHWQSTKLPGSAAFGIGHKVVTVGQLDRRTRLMSALYGVEAPKDRKGLDTFHRDSAKAYAVSLVLKDQARRLGISVPASTAQQQLDSYVTQQLGSGADAQDQFVQLLGNAGVTESDVLDELRDQLTVSKLFAHVTRGVTVSDDEARAAFPKFEDQLGVPEKRHLLNIVVSSKERANQLLRRLQGGADFAAVARRYSIDASTRDKGGDLGSVSTSMLEPAYAEAAFAVRRGDLFGPVQTDHGWNVGKVVKVTPAQHPAYEDVKEQLRQLVTYDEQLRTWQRWLGKALRAADIRYADRYRPDHPYSVPATTAPTAPAGSR